MNAIEAIRTAHEAGISVSLIGDFIRYQSCGPPPAHVLNALKAAKPEIVALLSRFCLDASGALAGDQVLYNLAQLGFSVRLCGDQAALDDETGQGHVPPVPLLYRFADNQTEYGLVLRVGKAAGARTGISTAAGITRETPCSPQRDKIEAHASSCPVGRTQREAEARKAPRLQWPSEDQSSRLEERGS
jgi:hypothetical protein